VDPGVDRPAHVLDERAEEATRDRADDLARVAFDVDGHPVIPR
jgi:hypothetical protein